jgi:hypothetical protein
VRDCFGSQPNRPFASPFQNALRVSPIPKQPTRITEAQYDRTGTYADPARARIVA